MKLIVVWISLNVYSAMYISDSSEVELKVNQICQGSGELSFSHYDCLRRKFEDYFLSGNYADAASVLGRIVAEFETSDKEGMSVHLHALKQLQTKFEEVSYLNEYTNKGLVSFLNDGYFTFSINGQVWILDTGATFGAVNLQSEKCHKYSDSGAIIGAFSNTEESIYCLIELDNFGLIPLNITEGPGILGLAFIIPFQKISINSSISGEHSEKVPVDYNGHFIYINGDISFKNFEYNKQKLCIDSGAKKTVFTQSFYNQIRNKLLENSVERIIYSTPFGQRSNLVKRVSSLEMSVSGLEYTFHDLPVLLSQGPTDDCHAILGMDFLENMRELNLRDKYIELVGISGD